MRTQRTGLLALVLIGGFYAYRNRFKIQQFLESLGINTPLDRTDLTSSVRSGFAKVAGKTEKIVNDSGREMDRAV